MFLKPVDSSFTDTELDISIPIIIDIPLEFNSSDDVTEVNRIFLVVLISATRKKTGDGNLT